MTVSARLAAPQTRPHRPLDMQVRRSAEVSSCERYRWVLRRTWDDAVHEGAILPWIMLNPSTADGAIDDPTLQRIIGFSWRWGFDGLLVVNLFPFRSPKPAMLREWLRWDQRQDWAARDAIWANQSQVAELLRRHDAAIAAWGAPAGDLGWTTQLAAEALLDKVNDPDGPEPRGSVLKLFCLGETGAGEPKHPMARGLHRVPDNILPARLSRYPGTIVGLGSEVAA